jgi:hypothetical protein
MSCNATDRTLASRQSLGLSVHLKSLTRAVFPVYAAGFKPENRNFPQRSLFCLPDFDSTDKIPGPFGGHRPDHLSLDDMVTDYEIAAKRSEASTPRSTRNSAFLIPSSIKV